MNEKFTLEKLKIHERLASLEAQHKLTNEMIQVVINRHEISIFGDGNGKRGLNNRVDRLEVESKNKRAAFFAFMTANIGIGCKFIWDFFNNRK